MTDGQHRLSTTEVGKAINNLPDDIPFAGQIRNVLLTAYGEACEDETHWEQQGMPHLSTFLKTTRLGIAIVDLARTINESEGQHD